MVLGAGWALAGLTGRAAGAGVGRHGRAGAGRTGAGAAGAGALGRQALGRWDARSGTAWRAGRAGSWAGARTEGRGRRAGGRAGARGRARGRQARGRQALGARGARGLGAWAGRGSALGALGPFSIRFDSFFFPESRNEHCSL